MSVGGIGGGVLRRGGSGVGEVLPFRGVRAAACVCMAAAAVLGEGEEGAQGDGLAVPVVGGVPEAAGAGGAYLGGAAFHGGVAVFGAAQGAGQAGASRGG